MHRFNHFNHFLHRQCDSQILARNEIQNFFGFKHTVLQRQTKILVTSSQLTQNGIVLVCPWIAEPKLAERKKQSNLIMRKIESVQVYP